MKRFLLLTLFLISTSLFGTYQIIPEQVSIGSSKPDASASLQLTGTTKGFIPNKLTTAQKLAIPSPATGLIVFDTNLSELQIYNGAGWATIGAGGVGGVDAWATSTVYAVNDVVIYNQELYLCQAGHTSGDFVTDLGSGYWLIVSDDVSSTGTIVDRAIPVFEGTSGNVVSSSDVEIDASNNLTGAASIAIGGSLDTSSIFDTVSTSKGTRPCPSMTEAQRDLISTPAISLCVYNTTTETLNIYDGSAWKAAGGGISNWETSRNYKIDDVVIESEKIYQALTNHTAGTFATDLANGDWVQLANDVSTSTGILPIANGGTGSATQNFVDLTTNQTVAGEKTFSNKARLNQLQATSAAGVDLLNSSSSNVAIFGAGGSTGTSLLGTTNIGSSSNDYTQVSGGTGSTSLTAIGSSTNIDINLTAKGSGSVVAPKLSTNDTTFSVKDSSDPTKQITLDASGTTGTLTTLQSSQTANRLITLPDATTTLVGTTGAQTISDKTFVAPILGDATGTSLTLTDKVDAKNLMNQLNSLTDPQVERAATLWGTYADAAGTAPVDGTGNINSPTPVDVTVSNSTSSPLRQARSLVLVKDAVNRQGQGISQDFTIDTADQGKVLQASFDYQIASGTYADNDVSIWIYDVTNARIIQPAPYLLKNSGIIERMAFEFQSAINSTSYRLIAHVSSTSALAYSLKFDNFSVGQQAKLYGSAVTDPIDYTPTISPNTNATPTAKWHREGKYLVVDGKVTWTGTGSQAYIVFSLPSGLSIDTTALPSGSVGGSTYLGSGAGAQQAVQSVQSVVAYNNTTSVAIYGGVSGTPASNKLAFDSNLFASAPTAGSYMNFYFKVPILGWSSSQIMSSDADTRVVAARYSLSSSQSIPDNSSTVIVWNSIANGGFDTHSAMNTSNGRYYAKVSGYYSFNVGFGTNSSISTASGNRSMIYYRVNSDFSRQLSWTSYSVSGTERISENGGASAYLNAGDYIEFLAVMDFGSPSYNIDSSGGGITYLSINRISGPSQIAASESVAALYTGEPPTGTIGVSYNTVNFGTKVKDSHNAYSGGSYTVPQNGVYDISAGVRIAGTHALNSATGVAIYIDGVFSYQNLQIAGGAVSELSPHVSVNSIPLKAGQVVTVRAYSQSTTPTYVASGPSNFFSIVKSGNY